MNCCVPMKNTRKKVRLMKTTEFNDLSEKIQDLEYSLMLLGESEEYLIALKLGYIDTFQENPEKIMNMYYSHLEDIQKLKYGVKY